MLSLLFFIAIFALVIVLMIISAVFGVVRSILGSVLSIFGLGRRNTQNQSTNYQDFEQPSAKSKIFDKNEGEYVDFEEVK
jgi:hypothetical protein